MEMIIDNLRLDILIGDLAAVPYFRLKILDLLVGEVEIAS